MPSVFDELRSRLERIKDLNAAASVLEWDQETYMPDGAAGARAHQIATLRTFAHELFTTDEVGRLLDEAEARSAGLDPLSFEASLARVARHDYEQAVRVPAELVSELAETVARAKLAWRTARETNDYAVFAPYLTRLIDLNVRRADALGYEEQRYDALLDQFEPGLKTSTVADVFGRLRAALVPIVHALAERTPPDDRCLRGPFDRDRQWAFGLRVLRDLGYDFDRGRQDLSAHPFTTSFSTTDVRITTRVDERFFPSAFFGTLHEGGHALYEQGIDAALDRTPLADGTSLGMHESQSRLWENLVGRSRPFWEHYYPHLQALFPEPLGAVPLDTFYRAVNRVAPTPIRVEADEVTYNLHVMLRFELEQEMLEGRVSVADLPALWDAKMEEYLGIRPETDASGVLQDIHWSLGTLGYFPTYTLGNLMSAQLFDQARRDLPDLSDQIAAGRFGELHGWLRTHIYRYGRKLRAEEILQRVTGRPLQAEPWLAYIREKYEVKE
jgi:carboxypeptidase Taq